jgi:hypothetical protein
MSDMNDKIEEDEEVDSQVENESNIILKDIEESKGNS